LKALLAGELVVADVTVRPAKGNPSARAVKQSFSLPQSWGAAPDNSHKVLMTPANTDRDARRRALHA
jgi:hypothetical protein